MRRVRILTLICLILSLGVYALKTGSTSTESAERELLLDPSWLSQNDGSVTPTEDRRPADQTFLTFPEWYLVFSPEEQAQYASEQTITTFPLMSHVDQVWNSYAAISRQIEPHFEYNEDYHFMIQVIGVSTSVEYSARTFYETLVGRLTDTGDTEPLTAEDAFYADYLQDYVDFLDQQPWYQFDYAGRLRQLWLETDYFGSNMVRKWERRYFLTTELLVKMAYAPVVASGANSMNDNIIRSTVVVVDRVPAELEPSEDYQVEEVFADGSALIRLPRYAAFNPAAVQLAQSGIEFREVAGNDSAILLSILVEQADELANLDNSVELFVQESEFSRQRIGLVTTVPMLAKVINALVERSIHIEHIYDY